MRARQFALRLMCVASSAVVVCLLCVITASADTANNKKVLLLFTHESHLPAQIIVEQAMRSTLETRFRGSIEIYSEYLDAVRTPLKDYEGELVGQLQRKYGGKQLDLVFAINPPALQLLLRNRVNLFSNAPIVFLVLDQRNIDGLTLGPDVTGIWGETNSRSNLELALALHPGTKKVVAISGSADWDNYWRSRVQEDFRALEGQVEISYLIGLNISEQQQALSNLPPKTIVFFISSTRDNAGNSYGNVEVLRQISPASIAPIYGTSDAHLGQGIVGGRLTSFEAFGAAGAEVGLRVLSGEKPSSIAPHGVPAVPMFDWRELKRWGITDDQLPAGSIVRFKVPTFWDQYWGRILIALTLILAQAFVIALLLLERRRRQRARHALNRLNAELEQRIAARTAALDAKTKELETFAYSVAHDLKAPLRGIDGYSRLLLEEHSADLGDESRSFVETIHTASAEMGQLIDDLLDYSRLERRSLSPLPIELQPLIKSIVEEKRVQAPEETEFVVEINGGKVFADVNGLTQALRNYIDNAIKFTANVQNPRIEIGSEETAGTCRIWVLDNGVGFDMKYHERIFEIFQRLNRAEEYPGTGVGLAIVRKSMERMGGRAWAESTPGKGAKFYLEIPKGFNSN